MIVVLLVLLIIVVALLIKVTSFSDRLRTLEWNLQNLQRVVSESMSKLAGPGLQPPPAAPAAKPVSSTTGQPTVVPTPVRPSVAISPPTPQSKPSRTREEFEAFIGGRLLNRIGALALIIGVGFFLKYAFDNDWITETMRVIIGFGAGIATLFLGVRTHRKGYQIFAQGLFGAGIAILYLSAYAAFSYYHLVSQFIAFGLMSIVTIVAFIVALRYDSLAISLLAWAGGYLTPVLLSTGQANEAGLFSYLTFLEAGLLLVAARKPAWIALEPLTLFGTYAIFLSWYQSYYTEHDLGLTIIFLSVFWGLFFIADLYRTLRAASTPLQLRQLMQLFNAGVYYTIMYVMIDASEHRWMGLTTLIICAVYVVNAALQQKYAPDSKLVAQNAFTATILLILATAIQFSGFTTVQLWSVEAIVLLWCARRLNFRYIVYFAAGLYLAGVLKLASTTGAFGYPSPEGFTLLFNHRAMTYALLAASLCTGAILVRTFAQRDVAVVGSIFHAAWIVVIFALLTIEINDFFELRMLRLTAGSPDYLESVKIMTMIGAWTLYALPLVYLGLTRSLQTVAVGGLLVVTVTFFMSLIRGFAFSPIEEFYPILNVRALAVCLVLGGAILHCLWLQQHGTQFTWARDVNTTLATGAVVLLLCLLTGETRDIFERMMAFTRLDMQTADLTKELTRLENLKQMSLSSLWLLYGIALMTVGIWRRLRGVRIVAIILFGIATLKIFVYDLSFLETLYRIFSFIGLGMILLAVSYLYQKYKSLILE